MEVRIKYNQLIDSVNFLTGIKLKGKKSIHRTRFVKALTEKLKQVSEEELALIKEYAHLNEEGEPVQEEGNYKMKDAKGFKAAQTEYMKEDFVIEGGDAHGMLKTVKDILENYDEEVNDNDAFAFEHLYTAFENIEGGEK